jgi:hypothetical protein
VVEGRLVCGCMRWYCWAVREWSNIHTQGERVMEARRERQESEKAGKEDAKDGEEEVGCTYEGKGRDGVYGGPGSAG